MPIYLFQCQKCKKSYEQLTKYDETDKYSAVKCPHCNSKKKKRQISNFSFNFSDPIGTDRWNNDHDYRFHHNLPKVAGERETATKKARADGQLIGKKPYRDIDDISGGKYFGEVK